MHCSERAGCPALRLGRFSYESKYRHQPNIKVHESTTRYDDFIVAASRCCLTPQRPLVFFACHLAKANATCSSTLRVATHRALKFNHQPIRQRHSPSLYVHFPEAPRNNLTFFTTSISTQSMASSSSNVVGVHYRVGKKIGEGSFGVIFEGTNLLNNQQVAIKFVCAWQSWVRIWTHELC